MNIIKKFSVVVLSLIFIFMVSCSTKLSNDPDKPKELVTNAKKSLKTSRETLIDVYGFRCVVERMSDTGVETRKKICKAYKKGKDGEDCKLTYEEISMYLDLETANCIIKRIKKDGL